MKNLLLALVLTFLIGCRNITPEQKLSNIIETYQNFQQNSDSNYPLGDYSESKFEKRAFFCDSLLTQLQALNPNTLKEVKEDNHPVIFITALLNLLLRLYHLLFCL